MRYELDAKVTFKVDLFYRCLFVRPEGRGTTYVLPHKDVYWSSDDSATRAARQQAAAARTASDEAKTIQRREHDALYGEGAYENAVEQAREFEAARRAKEAQQKEDARRHGAPPESYQESSETPHEQVPSGDAAPLPPRYDSDGMRAASQFTEPDGPVAPHLATHTPTIAPMRRSSASLRRKASQRRSRLAASRLRCCTPSSVASSRPTPRCSPDGTARGA